ncbi:hypothetical protein SLS60_009570 [Paraconiothyrium brasiliense]|uniref:Uncharacterized protein n=1 Tax=Paraconiothyrium brasiliense TaxID=300254 RepID=A0ABR3QUR3_9PLEO
MAPGLFCVWSEADPDTSAEVNAEDKTFSDAISKLPGVTLGTQVRLMKRQVNEYPFSHEIPFMTMYDLEDVDYRNDEAFKEAARAAESRGTNACKPRIYEEFYRREVEGCQESDNISIVTCEAPTPEQKEGFWKWQKEVFTPSFLEGPTFLRARILKEVGGEAREGSVMPSAPYMWIFEWEDDELPWIELTGAAQSAEWVKYIEGGLIFQGMCYFTKRYTERFEMTLSPGNTDYENDGNSSIDSRSIISFDGDETIDK